MRTALCSDWAAQRCSAVKPGAVDLNTHKCGDVMNQQRLEDVEEEDKVRGGYHLAVVRDVSGARNLRDGSRKGRGNMGPHCHECRRLTATHTKKKVIRWQTQPRNGHGYT